MIKRSVLLVICLAAVMLLTAIDEAEASPARVAGLNLYGPYTGFTRDYVNTYPFPVAINRYPNLMWAHLGSRTGGFEADNRVMGMFHALGEDGMHGVLGVTLREDSPMDPILQRLNYLGAPSQQFDIIYGKDMESASLGLRFDMARSSFENDAGEVLSPWVPGFLPVGFDGYVNTWGVGVAVDFDLGENAMLELGGEIRAYSFKDERAGGTLEDDGSISLRLSGRVFHEWADDKTMIPMVTYTRTQIGEETSDVTDTENDFLAGVAFNQMIRGDDLLIYGAAIRMLSREMSNASVIHDVSNWNSPVLFMALEHRFRDWLVGRGGASQALATRDYGSDDPGNPDQNFLFNEFDFALGIALEFTDFTIDATLNQNYPFTGFWFVSGEETNDLFGQVSFTYTY